MIKNICIKSEAKNSFKNWTKEGLEFLSQDNQDRPSTGKLNFHKILQEAIRELEDES